MKKLVFLLCAFLCGCVSEPLYGFKSISVIEGGNKEKIFVASPQKTAVATQIKYFFEKQLKNNGFQIVQPGQKARYGLTFGFDSKQWQSMRTVPIFGETSVRSVNTDSYGNLNGTYNYMGNGFGMYHANYLGGSNSTVDYNYGLKGYQNVIDNHFQIDFTVMMMDFETRQIVYESHLIGLEPINNENFAEYVRDVYSKYPMFVNQQMELNCYKNGVTGVCEVPKGLFTQISDI